MLASHEERECQRLVQQVIELQMKKMHLKMSQFEELENLLEGERRSIEAARKQLYSDRLAVQRQLAAVNDLLRKASTAPQNVRPDELAREMIRISFTCAVVLGLDPDLAVLRSAHISTVVFGLLVHVCLHTQ